MSSTIGITRVRAAFLINYIHFAKKHCNLQCFLPSHAPNNLHLSCRDFADANDARPKLVLKACIHSGTFLVFLTFFDEST